MLQQNHQVNASPSQQKGQIEQQQQKTCPNHSYIGQFQKAPFFMQDNHHITDGYRINFNTNAKILKSIFMIHNQTVNIWTHCCPAIILTFILISLCFTISSEQLGMSFASYRDKISNNINDYCEKLQNISTLQEYRQEVNQQFDSFKVSMITNFELIVKDLQESSNQLLKFIENQVEDMKISVKEELHKKIIQLQEIKKKYEQIIIPKIINDLQIQLDHYSIIYQAKNHLESFKQFLDSNIFEGLQLNKDIPNTQHISRWPIFVFIAASVFCLLCSSIFHIYFPISQKAYGLLLRFDFAGISLLIAGSAFPTFYYALYCQMPIAILYLSFSFISAIICTVVSLFQWIHKRGNQIYRSVIFGGFGITMVVPLSHITINQFVFDNYGDPYKFSSLGLYYGLLISSYVIGLLIFTFKCPERNKPGKFNICCHSHQIWHVLVVTGIIFTYIAVLQSYQLRKVSMCPV